MDESTTPMSDLQVCYNSLSDFVCLHDKKDLQNSNMLTNIFQKLITTYMTVTITLYDWLFE